MSKGILTVISGFSGAGKGTIMKALIEKYPYALSTSATTRNPREGETDGKEYFFISKDEFEKMIEENGFIEYAKYVDNYYGTPKKYVEEQLALGKDVLLEIEMQGGLQVKEAFPEAALIFITPPSADELKNRLVGRGTEDIETINKRLSRASEEAAYMKDYDYIIINDDLDESVERVHNTIQSLHYRKFNQKNLIAQMTEELKKFK